LVRSAPAAQRGTSAEVAPTRSAQDLLLEFVRDGRQPAFEEIVRRYAGMVFSTCLRVLRDTHDAEDATQAVFLQLAVQARTGNGVKYLAPWLQKVAQRLSLDIKRSKTRRKAREEKHGEMRRQAHGRVNGGSIARGGGNGANGNGNGGLGLFQNDDHTRQMDLEELKLILRDELDNLPAKYRLPLILHYFGVLKPEDMAKELGCKPSTLGVGLHRGR